METVFLSKLKPFLDAVAKETELYVPKRSGEHFTFAKYNPAAADEVEFNSIRTCVPVKEFLFPIRELAATYPDTLVIKDIKPFAVFGLKDCDLRSIAILDKVFQEEDFTDPFYAKRRESMFIISADCSEAGESCFCNLFEGKGFCEKGFDLNLSQIRDGFIVESGSQKGHEFIEKHSEIFADVPKTLTDQREKNREKVQQQLEENNSQLKFDKSLKQIVETGQDSEIFHIESKNCIECQACTRVCPTCHCFYLYDTQKKDYFAKMKMWDSCMRFTYAMVAGGENPNKILGDRIKHRFMHKFVHFFDRYGINMCVGCGRCVDADAGGMDLREVLKKLNEEAKDKNKKTKQRL